MCAPLDYDTRSCLIATQPLPPKSGHQTYSIYKLKNEKTEPLNYLLAIIP